MEDRGNIRVPDAGGGASLAQETKLGRFITQIAFANDLQGYRTTKVNIERLVGDAHRAATQLDRSASPVEGHFIVFESPNLLATLSFLSGGCSPR